MFFEYIQLMVLKNIQLRQFILWFCHLRMRNVQFIDAVWSMGNY